MKLNIQKAYVGVALLVAWFFKCNSATVVVL